MSRARHIPGIQEARGSLPQGGCFALRPFIHWLSHKSCHFRGGRLRLIFSLPKKIWSCISHTNGLNIGQSNIVGWIISFASWNCTSSHRKIIDCENLDGERSITLLPHNYKATGEMGEYFASLNLLYIFSEIIQALELRCPLCQMGGTTICVSVDFLRQQRP